MASSPQSNPGLIYGQIPTAGQWNSYFSAKQDALGFTPVNIAGSTMTGLLTTVASTNTSAGLNIPPGAPPSSPNNGDVWTTASGLFAQINGGTVGPFITSTTISLSSNNPWTGVNSWSNISQFNNAAIFGTAGGTTAALKCSGSISGTVTIQPQAIAGTFNFNLPTSSGTVGQVLVSGGGGGNPMTWTTISGVSTFPSPAGRLTLQISTPVMTSSTTAGTVVYYAPYSGNVIGLYNGTSFTPLQFTSSATDSVGLTLALGSSANWAAGTVYDVFVAYNGGTPILGTGPAWSSATARSAAGSIGFNSGFLVNSNASAMTLRTGAASTISVPQYQATYVGTICIDAGATGKVSFTYGASASGGTAANHNVWNYYNRVLVSTTVTDSGTSYTYANGSGVIREARASTGNRITFLSGVAEDGIHGGYMQSASMSGIATDIAQNGIGLDTTSAFTGSTALTQLGNLGVGATGINSVVYWIAPQIGQHFISANEAVDTSNGQTFNASASCHGQLSASFRM